VPIPAKAVQKSNDRFFVLFAGRDVSEKRFHLIYETAKKIGLIKPEITFLFAGPSPNSYVHLPNTVFLGEIKDQHEMLLLYEKSHVFILASSSEGFPRSMAEAMAYGAAIVSTGVGAIPEHIAAENGKLIFSSDEHSIVSSLIDGVLEYYNDGETRNKTGLKNYKYANQYFSFAKFSESYLKCIQELKNA
jgi:glycosyltransferase involved in cell wall biosynthesis